jgi:hypothetical protein
VTIITPSPPRLALPPVWSRCKWVLMTNRMGEMETPATAAFTFGVRGAKSSSMMNTPSLPVETPMFPPAPCSRYTPSARRCRVMVTESRFWPARGAADATRAANISRGAERGMRSP